MPITTFTYYNKTYPFGASQNQTIYYGYLQYLYAAHDKVWSSTKMFLGIVCIASRVCIVLLGYNYIFFQNEPLSLDCLSVNVLHWYKCTKRKID